MLLYWRVIWVIYKLFEISFALSFGGNSLIFKHQFRSAAGVLTMYILTCSTSIASKITMDH